MKTATDWRAVERPDGSIFFECGSPAGAYHCAFDVALDDPNLARAFCEALNAENMRASLTRAIEALKVRP